MNMEGLEQVAALLPLPLQGALARVPPPVRERVQEVRLRKDAPLTLSMPEGDWISSEFICNGDTLYTIFQQLCDYSVHSHQEELRQGYICAKNGIRAGIAGTAVVEKGQVTSMRNITSICLRVTRRHNGCAKELAFTLSKEDRLHSALICGEPSSGKTSLLRDLVRELAGGACGRRFRLSVVDERGELSFGENVPCEVLVGCPKAAGIEQALRTLSPEGVVFDELGSAEEVTAVLRCLNSGVAAIASLHADGLESLHRRPVARQALLSGAFEYVVLLTGRRQAGRIDRVLPVAEISL